MFNGSQVIGRDSFGLEKVKTMNRHKLSRAALQAIAIFLIAGQASAGEQLIDVHHDGVRGVTCWIVNNTGISCLPDSSLLQKPASSTRGEAQEASAVLATSICPSEQLPAAPLLLDERFQL